MTNDAASPLDRLDHDALIGPVRRVLADNAADLLDWQYEPLTYTVRNPLAGGVFRLTGQARVRGIVQPWSLILKIARDPTGRSWPDGRVAPPGWGTDPTHSQYWKREALAYRSGLLNDLPGSLIAPRCFGVEERGDDTIWLWLEEIHETERRPWSLARYGVAAQHLGQFNGAYLAGAARSLPTAPWLNRGFLRAWTADPARAAQTATMMRAETWAHPLVRAALPTSVAERLVRLQTERETLLALLEAQPQTLCHLDAFPGNLLTYEDAAGEPQTVALDWAFIGLAAVGEEIGHLVAWSLLLGIVAVNEAAHLGSIVLTGYVQGLHEAGWSGDVRAVARVAAVSAALRWAFSAANRVVRPALDEHARTVLEQDTGQPIAEVLAERARLVIFLLDWLDETGSS